MLKALENTTKTLGVFATLFRTVALVLLAIALISGIVTLHFRLSSETTVGRVTGFEEVTNPAPLVNPGGTNGFEYAVVEFETADAERSSVQGRSGRGAAQFDIGDTVPVRYRPSRPDRARIDSFMEIWATPVIFGGLFLVFAVIGIIAPYAFADNRGNRRSVSPVWPERGDRRGGNKEQET